jgi:nicotinate-nucleotide pyrophosphorylase (carboxylating)
MGTFTHAESEACRHLIDLALDEDLGRQGDSSEDVTSSAIINSATRGTTTIVARQAGVLAGLPAAAMVVARVDRDLQFTSLMNDGDLLKPGDRIASITGSMTSILPAERTALNFLQYMSGIATMTRRYVDAIAGCSAKILDTRKTVPGWRWLAKYAVRQGGGHNHRMGLFDQFLIKDNHWHAMKSPRNLPELFSKLRKDFPRLLIEIEVESLAQFDEALAGKPDIILLDNMPLDMMREVVQRRKALAPAIQLEASGGVNLQTVRGIAETGVDRISVGALTHSAPALDIALDYENAG